MTCVLSMTPLYTTPCTSYTEDGTDLQNERCDNFDFNWINSQNSHSGLPEPPRCSTPCRVEANTGSSITCRMEVSNGLAGTVKPFEPLNVHNGLDCDSDHPAPGLQKPTSINDEQSNNNLFDMCNKSSAEPNHCTPSNQGIKRKLDVADIDDVYIPSKRVSPFLNTPKERKDERKKILKISIKKLKQLEDPEAFLRRTVLVNNTMRRLQTELREEKIRSKKFDKKKSFSGYGVLNNNCLSNSYLFDDPFLSGVHEKITDDMTDTLMHNVFHDKPNDTTHDSNSENELGDKGSNLDNECKTSDRPLCYNENQLCNTEISDTNSKVDSNVLTTSDTSSESSNPGSSDRNTFENHENVACKNSSHSKCACSGTGKPEMSVDRCVCGTCDELASTSIIDNVENSKTNYTDKCEPMQIGQCSTECNGRSSYQNENPECDKLHLTNQEIEKSTDVQINSTEPVQKRLHTDKDNLPLTSRSAINGLETISESTSGLDLLDLDPKLDQKSLSHSFSTFLSVFDVNHSIPISLSYKES